MKTIFTFSLSRTFVVMFAIVFFTHSLAGQTTHSVSVTNGSFTPKELTITAGDKVIWTNNGTNGHNVNGTTATFPSNPESFGNDVGLGWTYEFTFNIAGTYDYQCDPHAIYGMVGKVIVNAKPEELLKLTVNFTGMTPHVGETLWLAVIDKATNMEIGRVKKAVDVAAFSIEVPGIETGKSYSIDFYADHNKNWMYDAPPVDHAWRMELNNVTGNSELNFAHNTNFTNIEWMNKLTVHFTGMTPHLNEMLTLYLVQKDDAAYMDTVMMESVATTEFDMVSYKIKTGMSYNIDFYADHNKNGVYDAPPADHAWRIVLDNVKGDTLVNFAHNTIFTDIFSVTSVPGINSGSDKIAGYPNPASDYINLKVPANYIISAVKVYSTNGAIVDSQSYYGKTGNISYQVSQLKKGIYFIEINSANRKDILKFIKQ